MSKRSNPGRSTPTEPPRGVGIDYETGEMHGDRLRTDFAGSKSRKVERGIGGQARHGIDKMQAGWGSRGRVAGANGPLPTSGLKPKPPPVLVLYQDLAEVDGMAPAAVYGQFPRALIGKLLPWLRCARHEILHVCSGSLPPGEGTRVDVRHEARPDILADGRALPLRSGSWRGGILVDPPYSAHYARELYGVEYPRPSQLLREAARVIAPGGRIGLVHYITAKPVDGIRFVRAFGLSTGFDMPMRAVSIYERDQAELDLSPTPEGHPREATPVGGRAQT
jgi:hypothetical protein